MNCPRKPAPVKASRARRWHYKQWKSGRHKNDRSSAYAFPFKSVQDFVRVCIPTKHLDAVAVQPALVPKYTAILRSGKNMGPSWAQVHKRVNFPCQPIYVRDGNHRALAAKRLGRKQIEVIMPRADFERYKQLKIPSRCR